MGPVAGSDEAGPRPFVGFTPETKFCAVLSHAASIAEKANNNSVRRVIHSLIVETGL